ncbi:hypothetical protein CFC21_068127 [Triticum aestivum]|uniref:Bifunctional inhibitor/plant lipid transfer protein/seed storage helical domain-containing protein n=3 Tax=Triticum aestivum TaxID=4565 RepID=A0A9R1KPC3_WHEAT|nr:hypothetical protein CFC21_068127 [Triticum aestivum]
MSSSSSVLLAAAVALTLLVSSASAQSGCTTALVGLYPCMNYISGNDTAPTKSCCSLFFFFATLFPGSLTKDMSFLLAAGGGSAPGAGSGSKTTPTAYLQGSGGSSLHGMAGLVLALSAAVIFVVSTV